MMKRILLSLVALLFSGVALAAVNLNTATKEELEALNGIGPVKAQAIIDYRNANGPFKSVEDVMKVKGIKEGEFGKIRGDISVSGATTPKAGAAQKSAAAGPSAPAPTAENKAKRSAAIAADNEARAKGKEQRAAAKATAAKETNAKGTEEKTTQTTAKEPMAKSSDSSKSASTMKPATDKSKSTADAAAAKKNEEAAKAKK